MKRRLEFDMDASLQRRLSAMAELKGVSIRRYCRAAIERELARDESRDLADLPFGHEVLDRLAALRTETFQDETLSGNSADLIREARDSRAGFGTIS